LKFAPVSWLASKDLLRLWGGQPPRLSGRACSPSLELPLLPRAFPDHSGGPGAVSSLTVARQRGSCTRFPVLLKRGGRANL